MKVGSKFSGQRCWKALLNQPQERDLKEGFRTKTVSKKNVLALFYFVPDMPAGRRGSVGLVT